MKIELSTKVRKGFYGMVLSWILLFVSFGLLYGALGMMQNEERNPTEPVVCVFTAIPIALLSTGLSPREPVYDIVRYFLMGVLAVNAHEASTRIMWTIIVIAVLFIPSVVDDFRGKGKIKREESMRLRERGLAIMCDESEPRVSKSSVDIRSVLKNKGYSHIRTEKSGLFETTYSARDRHGDEWTITCERDGGKIKIKGARKQGMTDDDLIAMMEAFSDD